MPKARGTVTELKVTLRGLYPPIWRRLQVPSTLTLADLHRVLQVAFDWRDEHRHRFTIEGRSFDSDREDEVILADHAAPRSKLSYEYDFGARWQHDITVEHIGQPPRDPKRPFPICVSAARAAPPEDCGGPWGYMGILEALEDPKHPDHDTHLAFVGVGWNAERVQVEAINVRLEEAFAPRKASKSKPKSASLTTPLSDDETKQLALVLAANSDLDVSGFLGVLHAVVVAPGEVDASAWMDHVFPRGFGGRDREDGQRRLSLLMRQYNEVATALADGRVIAPAVDDVRECRSFASGYLRGGALDDTWWNTPALRVFFLHLAYLAGRFDVIPTKARAKLEADGDPEARICEMLGGLVLGAYEALREKSPGAKLGQSA